MPADDYSPLLETADWRLFCQSCARQRTAGLVAAVLLVVTLAFLVDGLLSRMLGGGSYRLEMLAGTSEPVSGPMGSAPRDADAMRAFPIPADAPLEFEFLGFFSSYWFGTGMWRGMVHVGEAAEGGTYALAVGIEGQPSSSFQTYTISVSRSLDEQQRQSLSFVTRMTGWNPFWVAGFFFVCGLGCVFGCVALGSRCGRLTRDMGLAEIFKVQPEGELMRVFVVTGKREVNGNSFVCYDQNLRRLGKVIREKEKGGLTEGLFVAGDRGVPAKGCYVSFWEPELPEFKPVRRGIFPGAMIKGAEKLREKNAGSEGSDGSGSEAGK